MLCFVILRNGNFLDFFCFYRFFNDFVNLYILHKVLQNYPYIPPNEMAVDYCSTFNRHFVRRLSTVT
jgi:hypothetical protein